MITSQYEHGSFRDRTNRVFYADNTVYRALNDQARREWELLSGTNFFSRLVDECKIVHTENAAPPDDLISAEGKWPAFLRHQTIPFITYPYEWSFGMLKDAALLQIELLLAALQEGLILKDSSAFNFQWIGSNPIFIDIPSFVKLSPGDPWVGYRQFCQMFLYPLMLQAYKGLNFQMIFRGNIEGIEPEHFNKLITLRDLFRRGVFLHVCLQAKAQIKYSDTKNNVRKNLRDYGFNSEMIRANVVNLQKVVQDLTWKKSKSQWSHYMKEHSYTDSDHDMKKTFVRAAVASQKCKLVWDLGCNTGTFSRIAAENSQYVIAMDADHLAVESLYQELKKEGNSKILPLVVNIADPSPNLGWRGMERKTLRERGNPDFVLCLALIHHMVIGSNIPMKEFIDWLASLGASLIIEFATKDDLMVKRLLRNKEDIYSDYEVDYFEHCLSEAFDLVDRKPLTSGTRVLYSYRVRKITTI